MTGIVFVFSLCVREKEMLSDLCAEGHKLSVFSLQRHVCVNH